MLRAGLPGVRGQLAWIEPLLGFAAPGADPLDAEPRVGASAISKVSIRADRPQKEKGPQPEGVPTPFPLWGAKAESK